MPTTAKSEASENIQPAVIAAQLTAQLRAMGDPVKARGVQKYFKQQVVALGINSPVLRQHVNSQLKTCKPAWRLDRAIIACDLLLAEPELELRGAGILILAAFKKQFGPELISEAKRWFETRLDNWALVDSFCTSIISPLIRRNPELQSALRSWSKAKSLWLRRAALVTLVPFARRGEKLDTAYQFASHHLADPEDLMHKAIGWLLREAGKTDRARLREFLLRKGPRIPRTALRYAIEKFPVAERAELLRLTRRKAK